MGDDSDDTNGKVVTLEVIRGDVVREGYIGSTLEHRQLKSLVRQRRSQSTVKDVLKDY